MSFLAGRLAGKEAAYFFEESKHAVSRLVEKNPKTLTTTNPNSLSSSVESADILPEVLRHSLPAKVFRQEFSDSSFPLSNSSKWAIRSPNSNTHGSSVSPDVLNPLRGYLSLPQVTFGPKRWYFFPCVVILAVFLLNFFGGFYFVFVGFRTWVVSFICIVFRNGFFLAQCTSIRAVLLKLGKFSGKFPHFMMKSFSKANQMNELS